MCGHWLAVQLDEIRTGGEGLPVRADSFGRRRGGRPGLCDRAGGEEQAAGERQGRQGSRSAADAAASGVVLGQVGAFPLRMPDRRMRMMVDEK
jgi:hypothetical protein